MNQTDFLLDLSGILFLILHCNRDKLKNRIYSFNVNFHFTCLTFLIGLLIETLFMVAVSRITIFNYP